MAAPGCQPTQLPEIEGKIMRIDKPSPSAPKALLAALLLASSPLAAAAAPVVPAIPNAGTILQEITPVTPPEPSSADTGLRIAPRDGVTAAAGAAFLVRTLSISGHTLFDTATLRALVSDSEGKELTLSQLDELAGRITDYYHKHGYPLARAIIPAQTISDGVVRMEIIEARYGKINLDNSSRVDDPLLAATLSPLQAGQMVEQSALDRALLLLSDVPGVAVTATLQPGEAVGTSDLLVATTPTAAVTGNVTLSNYGSSYTGYTRIGGTVNLINPLHHGDVLTLSGLSSGSDLTNYARVAYESLLNGQGSRMGGAYSALRYVLGGSLSSLDGHGNAEVASLSLKHPLLRSRKSNLYGQLEYDHLTLRDQYDVGNIRIDRHLNNWTASLAGDIRDDFVSGAVASWNLAWTAGQLRFDDPTAQAIDAATARTEGGFSKLNLNLARLQALSEKNALYLAFFAQWANTNLDSSQKMIAGGPYTVRAYALGAVSGDTGYLGTAEFRRALGTALEGRWEGVLFVDSAHVTVNKSPWVSTTNSATLSGAGAGLNWAGPDEWSARLFVAATIGAIPTLVGNTASARAWVQVGKTF
jgi:hemolysin activation/secretion protein